MLHCSYPVFDTLLRLYLYSVIEKVDAAVEPHLLEEGTQAQKVKELVLVLEPGFEPSSLAPKSEVSHHVWSRGRRQREMLWGAVPQGGCANWT